LFSRLATAQGCCAPILPAPHRVFQDLQNTHTLVPVLRIQNNQPFPATVIAVMPQTHVYDR